MNQSDSLILNGIKPKVVRGNGSNSLDMRSPYKIGSSATAIGVACVPFLIILFIVLGYKIYSKYFARTLPRHLYSKRESVVTSMSTISSSDCEYTSVPPLRKASTSVPPLRKTSTNLPPLRKTSQPPASSEDNLMHVHQS